MIIPSILEYEGDRVRVTAFAYSIPEIRDILDKYNLEADPYLAYIAGMSMPNSPYKNIPLTDREETVIFDVKETLGEFDIDDELLNKAIERLLEFFSTPMSLMADELGEELHRFRLYLKNTPLVDGSDGNLRDRMTIMKEIEKIATNYTKVKKLADEELSVKMKGTAELGEY